MTGFVLKLIALITMIIDHTGALLTLQDHSKYFILRCIGRIAFPIYAFMISEGLSKTRNIRKYLTRLFIFALISELPFDLLFENIKRPWARSVTYISFNSQNVFFTLFIGALAVYCYERLKAANDDEHFLPRNAFALLVSACVMYSAELLRTDYGLNGALLIFMLYHLKDRRWQIGMIMLFIFELYAGSYLSMPVKLMCVCVAPLLICFQSFTLYHYKDRKWQIGISLMFVAAVCVYSFLWDSDMRMQRLFVFACVSPLLICLYNGKRGPGLKWAFYAAYPVHLLILAGIWFFYLKQVI